MFRRIGANGDTKKIFGGSRGGVTAIDEDYLEFKQQLREYWLVSKTINRFGTSQSRLSRIATEYIKLNVNEDAWEQAAHRLSDMRLLYEILHAPSDAVKELERLRLLLYPSPDDSEVDGSLLYKLQMFALMSPFWNGYTFTPEEIQAFTELENG